MKVFEEKGRLIVDFIKGENGKREDAFYGLSGIPFAEWVSNTEIAYDPTSFSERTAYVHMRRIKDLAKTHNGEISDGALELIERYREKYEAEEMARLLKEDAERARTNAQIKLSRGCGWCEHLKWNADKRRYECKENGLPCEKSAMEVEMLFEYWKETKIFKRATPFPNKGCKYLEVLQ